MRNERPSCLGTCAATLPPASTAITRAETTAAAALWNRCILTPWNRYSECRDGDCAISLDRKVERCERRMSARRSFPTTQSLRQPSRDRSQSEKLFHE